MTYYLSAGAFMHDLIGALRYHARENNAPPRLIAKLDELHDLPSPDDAEDAQRKAERDLEDMEANRDDLADALRDLMRAVADCEACDDVIDTTEARQALSRSSGRQSDEL